MGVLRQEDHELKASLGYITTQERKGRVGGRRRAERKTGEGEDRREDAESAQPPGHY